MLVRYCYICCLGFALIGMATPARADTIRACVQEDSGALRILSAGGHCNPSENALAWSSDLGRETTAERAQGYPTFSEVREASNLADINLYLE